MEIPDYPSQPIGEVFMKLINEVLHDYLYKGVLVYLKDTLIFTETMEEHVKSVHQVLKKLLEANSPNVNSTKRRSGLLIVK